MTVASKPIPDEARFVDRDPCPYCATRRDIGCRHFRASGTPPVEQEAPPVRNRDYSGNGWNFHRLRIVDGKPVSLPNASPMR